MIKNLLFAITMFIAFNSFATPVTHTVTYGVTSNVICNVGDTLKFYGNIASAYGIQINGVTKITPHAVTMTPFYIGYYVVTSSDNSFTFMNTISFSGTINVNLATNLNEKNSSANIKLFPNPAVNMLQISVLNKTNLMVYTPTGQAVITTLLEVGGNEVDVSKLASGIYYVKVGDVVSKLVKE